MWEKYAANVLKNNPNAPPEPSNPSKELAVLWKHISPLLFGSIGASIKINELKGEYLINGLWIIILGVLAR